VNNACATGSSALVLARQLIEGGECCLCQSVVMYAARYVQVMLYSNWLPVYQASCFRCSRFVLSGSLQRTFRSTNWLWNGTAQLLL